jgi:hypothetical protein
MTLAREDASEKKETPVAFREDWLSEAIVSPMVKIAVRPRALMIDPRRTLRGLSAK